MEKVCRAYGHSRQGYYKRRIVEKKRSEENDIVLKKVLEIRKRQPKVGARKLQKMVNACLNEEGQFIGRDRLFDLLRDKGLLVARKRNYRLTTNSNHWFLKYQNLIKDLDITRRNQVYVSDITYISTYDGFCYLSLITDVYSRKIVGYALSRSLSVEGSLKALKMALREVKAPGELTHHSDRGIQYCCTAYTSLLKKRGVKISMTEKDHVYENALAERVNGILKDEFILGSKIVSHRVAKKMVKEAVEIYNKERLHTSLDYMTPEQKYAA